MPPQLSERKRAAILKDIDKGELSRNAIARKHKCSVSTVSRIASQEGRENAFDRSAMENATKAKSADMAARRAKLAEAFLDDVEKLRQRAWSAYTYYERGAQGPELVTLDLPPLRDTREAYTAAGIAVDKHLKLIEFDSADSSDGAKSMLGKLAAALNVAAEHQE